MYECHLNVYRAYVEMWRCWLDVEMLVESSADKHSNETVDKPILHIMT